MASDVGRQHHQDCIAVELNSDNIRMIGLGFPTGWMIGLCFPTGWMIGLLFPNWIVVNENEMLFSLHNGPVGHLDLGALGDNSVDVPST